MKRFLGILSVLVSVAAAFVAAFVAENWSEVEIHIPAKAVGTGSGVLAFVVTLAILVSLLNVMLDLVFYKSCRKMFKDMLSELWYDWRIILPAVAAFSTAWVMINPLGGVAAGIFVLAVIFAGVYIYGRGAVINTIGPKRYYRN